MYVGLIYVKCARKVALTLITGLFSHLSCPYLYLIFESWSTHRPSLGTASVAIAERSVRARAGIGDCILHLNFD